MPSPSRQNLYQPDFERGALRRAGGTRAVALSVDFIESFHAAILQQFGGAASDVLYRSGYEWGLQDMARLNGQLAAEIGGANLDLWQMEAKFIFEKWWTPLSEAGWGHCTFDLSSAARGRVCVDLQNSVIGHSFPGATSPVCHVYAGLFAAAVSFYERTERHATELQCTAMGQPACRFFVGLGAEVDSAEAMRKQGVSAADIIRRLG